ncbi:hypothetical protein THTE_3765 [Thermogutta terrifontis]|uniref:Uncharacterized protein n=1 Tax=Thermogutta terrifontis TaxID=1331910 RepID=A0A286RK86_9BACT|nr:hypothetical protein THTE_3765 [Thermogutta terrifontis]
MRWHFPGKCRQNVEANLPCRSRLPLYAPDGENNVKKQ